jgi:hypothetical protein
MLLVALLFSACSGTQCVNSILERAGSPDGTTDAILFNRGCGATTGGSTQVALVGAGEPLPDRPANVFVTEHVATVSIEWLGPRHLTIRFRDGTAIAKEEPSVNGVDVTFDRLR